ncbi:sugar phosphate isomerase/epimerase [Fulvivirgaceae bacterium PWU20]|uniref:Sugar phosphate isomerase/epimerase n=2 Tax=Chryseosolibacter indicus TaxID=2782351 RepID=A0ABS5VTA6_9BACT|nr:sugar phosphate isomerase/epimerase [Chryseosolibacter indicus]
MLSSCNGKSSSENTQDSTATASSAEAGKSKELFFKISLAQWSLHKALFAKEFDNLDFPVKAKNEFGITNVEYVNQFFKDKAKDEKYLAELKKRCDDNGVTSVLIMCDGEGELADLDAKKRQKTVENHYKWVDAAKFLGCHSIRVNAFGIGTAEEVSKAAIDGLSKLSEYAEKVNIGIIVENHGGYSSNGQWLAGVMKGVGKDNCGTLPDFGNFCIRREKGDMWQSACVEEYDRYKGVEEMMPFAKGVSAKTHDFDEQGNCTETDYNKMLNIVKSAGFNGYVGIEYEGSKLSEVEGIRATKALLERVGMQIA